MQAGADAPVQPRPSTPGVVLPLPDCERLCDSLAGCDDPRQAMLHIEAARAALLGPGLLTVNVDATRPGDPPGEIQLQRAWSSDAAAYPVGGRKRKPPTPWTDQLLVRGEVFIGEGDQALEAVFDDADRIRGLGLRAVVNVPILSGGRCRATFNVLGRQPQWQPQEVAAIRLLALLARAPILALASVLRA